MQIDITFSSTPGIKEKMELSHQLGQGKFKVYLITSAASETKYALKLFSRDFKLRQHYVRENQFISKLDHKNIIKYVPIVSQNSRFNVIITEFVPNGTFFDLLLKQSLSDEKIIRSYFHQLVEGLEYLHEQGIAHLDLKLENLMLNDEYALKIIDFDQAQNLKDETLYSLGTEGYRIPMKLLKREHQNLTCIDIFAAGVILYALKSRELPFNEDVTSDQLSSDSYEYYQDNKDSFWERKEDKKGKRGFYESDFKTLIDGMLELDSAKRFSIDDIKKSRWYNGPILEQADLKREVEQILTKM